MWIYVMLKPGHLKMVNFMSCTFDHNKKKGKKKKQAMGTHTLNLENNFALFYKWKNAHLNKYLFMYISPMLMFLFFSIDKV